MDTNPNCVAVLRLSPICGIPKKRRISDTGPVKNSPTLNVSIVEDDDRFRSSLARLIGNTAGLHCCGSYRTAEEALDLVPQTAANVVLMDINLPNMSGVECVRRLKAENPALQIIMLTIYEDNDMIFKALQAGAVGYLLKRSSPDEILEAIVEVSRGGAPMSSSIARRVVQSFQNTAPSLEAHVHLTKREEEVLAYVARGYVNKEIAEALSVSLETIRTHMKNIYEKLHVRSRTEAVLKCVHKG
jgi:DNA-binding NarL/FixJ family response regulator